jgi:hypothetical protein
MKLAEALILRADLKKRTEQLRERLRRNAKVQEGETPTEDPGALLAEMDRVASELETLVRLVNWTNIHVSFEGELRISDAIAMRDTLDLRIRSLRVVIDAASERDRFITRSEIKSVVTVDAAVLQKQLDELSRQRRDLDIRLQAVNWKEDLIPRHALSS